MKLSILRESISEDSFYEILSQRMLRAMKDRYMSEEQFEEIRKLIDVLF